jgi:hypothetical protein
MSARWKKSGRIRTIGHSWLSFRGVGKHFERIAEVDNFNFLVNDDADALSVHRDLASIRDNADADLTPGPRRRRKLVKDLFLSR